MRRLRFRVALGALFLTVGLGTLRTPVHAADVPGTTVESTTPEIVVSTPRGSATGGIEPLLELSPSELNAYGADSLSDLVGALRPLTRSSRSDQTAVVLINGHLAGQTEFDNLPREAIERVEEVSGTLSTSLDSVSNFGNLFSVSAGLDWHPAKKLHLDAIYTDHRTAPTVQQLQAPPISTRNVETFDYITQQTVYPTEIAGGNDALAPTDSRQDSFGLSIGPLPARRNFSLTMSKVVSATP